MLRAALRLVNDQAAADDIVQEAMLRAWRHRASCRRPHAPMPWLLAIVRNEAARWHAQARHVHERPDGELGRADRVLDEAPRRSPAVDMDVLSGMAVEDTLAELPDADRRLLGLRYGDELTPREIAGVLGVPDATVRRRLRRLRRRLQGELLSEDHVPTLVPGIATTRRPDRGSTEPRFRRAAGGGGSSRVGGGAGGDGESSPVVDVARRLRALGHPTRVQVVLAIDDARSPAELFRRGEIEMSLEALSYHVRVLHEAGLLVLDETLRRGGAVEHRYRLSTAGRSARELVETALHERAGA